MYINRLSNNHSKFSLENNFYYEFLIFIEESTNGLKLRQNNNEEYYTWLLLLHAS